MEPNKLMNNIKRTEEILSTSFDKLTINADIGSTVISKKTINVKGEDSTKVNATNKKTEVKRNKT